MKSALAILLLISACIFSVSACGQDLSVASAQKACGPSTTEFSIKINDEASRSIEQPIPGKALVFIIEDQKYKAVRDVTTRVGLDGAWIGANRGNSYLYFSVEPGEHHLCTDWISEWLPGGRLVSLSVLNAEAGKVYFFRARTTGGPGGLGDGRWQSADAASLDLDRVNSDEGKLLIASSALSISHPKK
ncbi:MAG: DUF2846 domain-containing protein [Candidatus Sulfotelmatobacter sp.]